jgi:cytoskeletal protein RodZ
MKKGTFGETLRREREMRGVSLEEVSNATRITTRNLEALENEQWEQLPGGVFNRGFIRSIAKFLGLDEEALVSEYVIATDDKPQVARWLDTPSRKPKKRSTVALVAVVLVILLAGSFAGLQALRWREAGMQSPTAQAATPNPAPNPVAAPTQPVAREPETLELKVDAAKATTARIVADGLTVFDGRLEARDSRKFPAKEKFEISVGDSFAVLLELNGQAVAPIGHPGEPGTIILTRKDLKKPEGQN